MIHSNRYRSEKDGFTLIELLIVISIIGILVTIVVIAINPQTVIQNTNDTKKRSEINQVRTALQLHFNELNNYPATGSSANLVPNYTRQLPTDWTDATVYGYASSGSDYAAGVVLENTDNAGNDGGTETRCQTSITASGLADDYDYYICPD